jgi:hypothetical protein
MLHACFYTICLVFRYTSWHFYAFFGTNLLTRCHSASSLFSAIFVFQKSCTGNFFRIGQTKAKHPEIYRSFQRTEEEIEQSQGWPHHQGARPRAWPCHPVVSPTWSNCGASPSPIKTPRREKPKYPINFPETHRDLPSSSTRDREGPKALPGTLPERGIATGGLLHRHACLWCDEWVVYLTLWVHSSS